MSFAFEQNRFGTSMRCTSVGWLRRYARREYDKSEDTWTKGMNCLNGIRVARRGAPGNLSYCTTHCERGLSVSAFAVIFLPTLCAGALIYIWGLFSKRFWEELPIPCWFYLVHCRWETFFRGYFFVIRHFRLSLDRLTSVVVIYIPTINFQ